MDPDLDARVLRSYASPYAGRSHGSAAVGLLSAAIALPTAALWALDRSLSSALESGLRRELAKAELGGLDSARLRLFSGRASIRGLRLASKGSWSVRVAEFEIEAATRKILAGNADDVRIHLLKPALEVSLHSTTSGPKTASTSPAKGPQARRLNKKWYHACLLSRFSRFES